MPIQCAYYEYDVFPFVSNKCQRQRFYNALGSSLLPSDTLDSRLYRMRNSAICPSPASFLTASSSGPHTVIVFCTRKLYGKAPGKPIHNESHTLRCSQSLHH